MGIKQLLITNYQLPITNYQLPLTVFILSWLNNLLQMNCCNYGTHCW
ncbi:MAG: hypothetical protein KME64_18065 [Scytonematopsis contorta HA4267-MV1]|nr:hypothetical protein [Scytonematopsis contorta HA4267-MV1]